MLSSKTVRSPELIGIQEGGNNDDEDDEEDELQSGKRQQKRPHSSSPEPRAKKRRGPRVEVEYEDTDTLPLTQKVLASW